jgi:beta-N-acetylhexosaminidase
MSRLLRIGLAVALAAIGSGGPVAAQPPTEIATATTTIGAPAAAGGGSMSAAVGATSLSSSPSIARMIGQKLIVRMEGTTPSADLLGRIQRGEVGGVILFGANITTATALRTLTASLQAAATAGGRPRLLIAVDQEGGSIKRIPWIPPTLSPPQMGQLASTSVARSQGSATGLGLRDLGINLNFAPVADVPSSTASFMYRDGRTWSFSASRTAWLALAFSQGLAFQSVVPTLKHFPGIGYATMNTDVAVVKISATRTQLSPGLAPYRLAITNHMPLIMLSNAIYPAYDTVHAAGWSPAIVNTLLRQDLGFKGVTITDSLDGAAHARGIAVGRLAALAARAGTDMILTTGSEAATRAEYAYLVRQAVGGAIPTATLQASYARILALKAGL